MNLSKLIDVLVDIRDRHGDVRVDIHSYCPNNGYLMKGELTMARFYECLNIDCCVPTVIIESDNSKFIDK